jgi:hypothetical protein
MSFPVPTVEIKFTDSKGEQLVTFRGETASDWATSFTSILRGLGVKYEWRAL